MQKFTNTHTHIKIIIIIITRNNPGEGKKTGCECIIKCMKTKTILSLSKKRKGFFKLNLYAINPTFIIQTKKLSLK